MSMIYLEHLLAPFPEEHLLAPFPEEDALSN